MRVVLATPYKIGNYGAMLQAWALKRVLESFGHEVRYLNCRYMWPGVFGWRRILCSKSIGGMANKINLNRLMRASIAELNGFSETRPYDDVADLVRNPPDCDCLMSGSDQIFGPNYFAERRRYLPVLLGFGSTSIKRIVYGASFGTAHPEMLEMNEEVRSFFDRIQHIGIRERSGLEVLRRLTGRDGHWTPDPTLLLTKDEYVSAFNLALPSSSRKYVCAYMLGWGGREQMRDVVCRNAMAKYAAEEVHILHGEHSLAQWLNEIAGASCVVTNSFHGHCFSLIFGRPCVVLGFDGADAWRNERNDDLLRVRREMHIDQISEAGYSYLRECLDCK